MTEPMKPRYAFTDEERRSGFNAMMALAAVGVGMPPIKVKSCKRQESGPPTLSGKRLERLKKQCGRNL